MAWCLADPDSTHERTTMATIQTFPAPRRYAGVLLRTTAMTLAAAMAFTVTGTATAQAGEKTAFREASPLVRSGQSIPNGRRVNLSATLYSSRGGVPNQIVSFYVKLPGKSWTYVGKSRTDVRGRVSLSPTIVVPGLTGRQWVTVGWAPVFGGTSSFNGTDARNGILGTGFIVTP